MPKPIINLDDFPIVKLDFQADPVFQDIEEFLNDIRPVFQRGKMVFLSDINALAHSTVNAKMRKALAEGIDQLVAEQPGHLVAEAVIASSTLVRGMFTAYNWLKSNTPYPSQAFATQEQARAWAEEKLREAGVK